MRGDRVVKPGLLFRGGALSGITDGDRDLLFGQLGISCVVDLRCGWERDAKPDVVVPGVDNRHIPFYDLEKVGIEYTEPAEGTKVVGRDVACNPERFYRSLANPLTVRQMAVALHLVFERVMEGRPVYVHCSGGKDRAGIMSLLILCVLGARRDAILEDYLLTNVSRDENYEYEFQRFLRLADGDVGRARELTESHRARPENLEAFYEVIGERYGGMDSFVKNQLGMGGEQCEQVRMHCTRAAML